MMNKGNQTPPPRSSVSYEDKRKTMKPPATNYLEKTIISKGKKEVSLAAFSFLFSEIVQYSQSRVTQAAELERRLFDIGYQIGSRYLELSAYRDKKSLRETKLNSLVQWIAMPVWKSLYGKQADVTEQNKEIPSQYMIYEKEPLECKFISVPQTLQGLHCSYFTAGVIKGFLVAAECPCEVKVCYAGEKTSLYTAFVIDFEDYVYKRDLK